MPNIQTIHSCSKCGAQYQKWQGRCNECGAWGTIHENIKTLKHENNIPPDKPINLGQIEDNSQMRLKTNIEELDRVLGGGIVLGSMILLGGDPGVGKSTLGLQIAQSVENTLYVSGEESANQVKIRAQRIGQNFDDFKFLAQTNVEKIIATIKDIKPKLAIIDSIQTINSNEYPTGLGSTNQITASTSQLLATAKETNTSIVIIGHVTKEGYVAGPKTLEHLVDTVLYLENDNQNHYKILRSVKNRFGSTGEIGVFEMTASGLKEIIDSASIFFEDEDKSSAGSATTIVMEGSRPFLIEIQALTAKTVFGYPQRKATGFDLNRLQMIIAVISKVAKLNLSNQDVYLNVAGGLKIKETGTDLAVAAAIISALLNSPISKKTLIFGEVGLSGEVRSVSQTEKRIKEAQKLKFEKIIIPKNKNLKNDSNIITVNNIQELIKKLI